MAKNEDEIPVFKKDAPVAIKPVIQGQKKTKPLSQNLNSTFTSKKKKFIIGLSFIVLVVFGILSSRMVIKFAREIADLQAQLERAQGEISRLESSREQMLVSDSYDNKRQMKLENTIIAKDKYIGDLEALNRKLQLIVDEKQVNKSAVPKTEFPSQTYSKFIKSYKPLFTNTPKVSPVTDKAVNEWKDAEVSN